jgi:carbamoyltransferase
MYTLGINAAYHDSAACLVRDGIVIAAAEEERFNRIKHGKRPLPFSAWELPYGAIHYCLSVAGITLAEVDHVAYSYNPSLLPGHREDERLSLPLRPSTESFGEEWSSPWEPLFYSYVVNAPRQLVGGAPHHLKAKFSGATLDSFEWHYVEHHLAHEASAFLAAPFENCAVMTLDGRGERATTTLGRWRGGEFTRFAQVDFPHSLGLLYEEVTTHLGFLHSSDEYKVMALASYGIPRHLNYFLSLMEWDGEGGFRIKPHDLSHEFGAARRKGEPFEQRHNDIASSLQVALEHAALKLADWLRVQSGEKNLTMAGGVALNCVMNARIRDSGLFERVWVQPAAGDAGTALGAALWIDWQARREESSTPARWTMDHAYLGPEFDDAEIEQFLRWAKLPYRKLDDVAASTADLLADDKIIGWFQGRMEFGPRALGARSILASPVHAEMQNKLNELKDREDFRPVAPSVLVEEFRDWFYTEPFYEPKAPASEQREKAVAATHQPPPAASGIASRPEEKSGRRLAPVKTDLADADAPYMLFIYNVRSDKTEKIPAAVHVDGTARVQTVSARANPRYHALLKAFQQRTGVPILINTSFNVRGEPIVCSPRDAVESFYSTPLDALVIGSFLVEKHA